MFTIMKRAVFNLPDCDILFYKNMKMKIAKNNPRVKFKPTKIPRATNFKPKLNPPKKNLNLSMLKFSLNQPQ